MGTVKRFLAVLTLVAVWATVPFAAAGYGLPGVEETAAGMPALKTDGIPTAKTMRKIDFSLSVDKGDLQLGLLLKAIDILQVYHGEFVDTVFFTGSKEQLKLILILKAITLLKHGKWPVDEHDLWPEMGEGEGGQSEATTTEQITTSEGAVKDVTADQPAEVTVQLGATEDGHTSRVLATEQTTNMEPPIESTTAAGQDVNGTVGGTTAEGAVPQDETTEPAVVNRGDIPIYY